MVGPKDPTSKVACPCHRPRRRPDCRTGEKGDAVPRRQLLYRRDRRRPGQSHQGGVDRGHQRADPGSSSSISTDSRWWRRWWCRGSSRTESRPVAAGRSVVGNKAPPTRAAASAVLSGVYCVEHVLACRKWRPHRQRQAEPATADLGPNEHRLSAVGQWVSSVDAARRVASSPQIADTSASEPTRWSAWTRRTASAQSRRAPPTGRMSPPWSTSSVPGSRNRTAGGAAVAVSKVMGPSDQEQRAHYWSRP